MEPHIEIFVHDKRGISLKLAIVWVKQDLRLLRRHYSEPITIDVLFFLLAFNYLIGCYHSQYTMLSGQVPFQSSGSWYRSSAGFVMQRITQGDIRFEGQQWQSISAPAKDLIQGNYTSLQLIEMFIPYFYPKSGFTGHVLKGVISCQVRSPRSATSNFQI